MNLSVETTGTISNSLGLLLTSCELAKLKEQGVLSEAEFQQMKQELIKKMT